MAVELCQRVFLGVGILADGIAKSKNGIQVRLWFTPKSLSNLAIRELWNYQCDGIAFGVNLQKGFSSI